VLLQVALFTFASFLVIGIRGGAWEPALFLAVPIVLCFFSYLFAICVLFGVMTRSTLASLLLTLLVWFLLFIAGTVENGLSSVRIMATFENAALGEEIKALESRLEKVDGNSGDRESIERELSQKRSQLEDNHHTLESIEGYARIFRTARNFLPKTSETVALLERKLIDLADLPRIEDDTPQMMIVKEYRSRSAWWIIGTSLAFEVAILALGAWIFCRRDY
jgi:ABC-type transport system involved in multi-copper enzyme maturation permease subunit